MIVLLPTESEYKTRFAELAEVIELVSTTINTYNSILDGELEPIYPRYLTSIGEIKNTIIEYAKDENVIAFTGVLVYIFITSVYFLLENLRERY